MPHAEISLYYGSCLSECIISGYFSEKDSKRYAEAVETIEKYLSPDWSFGLSIKIPYVTDNEKDAKIIVEFSESAFDGSKDFVEPIFCGVRRLFFKRKLYIKAVTEIGKEQIISEFSKAGYEIGNNIEFYEE